MIALLVRLLIILLALWLIRQMWRLLTLPPGSPTGETKELVACAACGTYFPKEKAATALFAGRRRYFCDVHCLERYSQEHRIGDA